MNRGERGSGVASYGEAMEHRRRGLRAPAELAVVAMGGGGPGLSSAFVGVEQCSGKREEEQGEFQEGPELVRPLAELGGVGHGQQGVREREGKEGARTVACCGRRGASTDVLGGPRWSGVTAPMVECPARRSRARLWPASVVFPRSGVSSCVWKLQGGVNKEGKALDALVDHWERGGVERE